MSTVSPDESAVSMNGPSAGPGGSTDTPDRRLAALRVAVDAGTSEPTDYLDLAATLDAAGRIDEALAVLEAGIRRVAQPAALLDSRAEILMRGERYFEALASLDWALDGQPPDALRLASRATLLCFMARYDEALLTVDHALDVDPHSIRAHVAKVVALESSGRIDLAREAAAAAVAAVPDSVELLGMHFFALAEEADRNPSEPAFQEALMASERWAAAAPDSAEPRRYQGLLQHRHGHDIEARTAFDAALAIDPKDRDTRLARCDFFVDIEDPDDASAELDALAIGDQPAPDVRRRRCDIHRQAGRYVEALAETDVLVAAFPTEAEWSGLRASILEGLEKYSEALVEIDYGLRLAPQMSWLLGTKSEILRRLGHFGDALAVIQQAVEFADEKNKDLIEAERASDLRLLGRLPEAMAASEASLALNPDNLQARNEKGEILFEMGRLPEAAEVLRHARELGPPNSFTLATLGQVLTELNELDEARSVLAEAVALKHPRWVTVAYANLLLLQRDFEAALAALDEAIDRDPEAVDSRELRAEVLRAAGRPVDALAECDALLQENPSNVFVLGTSAMTLLDLGRAQEGLDRAERATALANDYAFGWETMNLCLAELDRYSDALQAAEVFVRLSPGESQALFLHAATLLGLGRVDEAMVVTQSIKGSSSGDLAYMRGVILSMQDHLDEAVPAIEEAIASNGSDPFFVTALADVLALRNVGDDRTKARDGWRNAHTLIEGSRDTSARYISLDAWCKLCLGDSEAAVRLYLQAVPAFTSPLTTEFELLMASIASGQDSRIDHRAARWFQAVDAHPDGGRRRGLVLAARFTLDQVVRFGLVAPDNEQIAGIRDRLADEIRSEVHQLEPEL